MEILSMISIPIKGMKEHYWGFQLLPQHQKEPKKKKKRINWLDKQYWYRNLNNITD